ncbi:spore protease YyaC [Caldalkalibacillus salinus]|uniref:spore protease YyaC n=1 Tax=Caldalkalibacillus salinus TaxID=2803787 RepID=UPI0019221663|nr:spore protease YyaC [Caldalkalibacillus salinus]
MSIQMHPPTPLFRDSYDSHYMVHRLSQTLYSTLLNKHDFYDIVIVCIGTDRSTGDALGPIIGSKLSSLTPANMSVYGTLDEPVHAMNLDDTLQQIKENHRFPLIIAIDACLGDLKSVGKITLAKGPLKPGAGVQKKLPEVGDYHLTGIVNVGGFMEYFVLQNTRLSVVMKMADKITTAIHTTSTLLAQKKEASPTESFNRRWSNVFTDQ